jgi:peptidyl-prolyl cis-trans isomerase SurA
VNQDIVLDEIIAVVNNGVVLASDVRAEVSFLKEQASANRQALPADDLLQERVVERLIDIEIQRQHARDLGVSIDAASVNRAIDEIARNNNMDSLQFRKTLQHQGFDYDHFRDNIEQELLTQQLIKRDVESRIKVSAQEIDDFVDAMQNDVAEQQRYRILHILVAVPPTAPQTELDAARARARTVLEQLRNGDDFAQVAAAASDGARALQGGDLGWRSLQEVPDFLATALRTMAVGDISDPLQSPNGLHIVKLDEKRSGDQSVQAETLVRHIFIAGDSAETSATLQGLRRRLVSGESFAVLAAEFSEDPNSAPDGGELPWFVAGQMPAELEQAAEKLQAGELSEPFRTRFGWHLLEVLERRTSDVSAEALRQRAELALRQRKIEQETEHWIRQLRDESFIEKMS